MITHRMSRFAGVLLAILLATVATACASDGAGSDNDLQRDANGQHNRSAETASNDAAPAYPVADVGTPLPDGQWHIAFPNLPKNSASFISRSEERIVGTVEFRGEEDVMHGGISVDVAAGTATAGSIVIPVTDMRTGNPVRDEHLHSEDWLDAESHPNLYLRDLAGEPIADTQTLWTLRGTMEIHGTSQPFETVVNVRYYDEFPMLGENIVRIHAAFPLDVTDFGVEHPILGGPMVSEVWDVEVTFFGFVGPAGITGE